MALVVGWGYETIPLTKEVFGEDGKGEIIGCMDPLDKYSDFTPRILVIHDNDKDVFYLHPTLFQQCPLETFWVKLTLVDGKICMEPTERFSYKIEDGKKWYDDPVEMSEVSVQAIMLLQKKITELRRCHFCGDKVPWTDLNIYNTVIATDSMNMHENIMCAACYERLVEAGDEKVSACIIDGRKIPFLSKVPMFK